MLIDYLKNELSNNCRLEKLVDKSPDEELADGEYVLKSERFDDFFQANTLSYRTHFGYVDRKFYMNDPKREAEPYSEHYMLEPFRLKVTSNPLKDMAIFYGVDDGNLSHVSAITAVCKEMWGWEQTKRIVKYLKKNPGKKLLISVFFNTTGFELSEDAKIEREENPEEFDKQYDYLGKVEETETWTCDKKNDVIVKEFVYYGAEEFGESYTSVLKLREI